MVQEPRQRYVDIVGLVESTNGRSCKQHDVCGLVVKVGSLIRLAPVVVENADGQNEYAIGARIFDNGVESCLVGFVGREFHFFREQYEFKIVQVQQLLAESKNTELRRRSHFNRGVAVAYILE